MILLKACQGQRKIFGSQFWMSENRSQQIKLIPWPPAVGAGLAIMLSALQSRAFITF